MLAVSINAYSQGVEKDAISEEIVKVRKTVLEQAVIAISCRRCRKSTYENGQG